MTTVERTETLTAGPAEGLAGLLGVTAPDLEAEGLPLTWHWVYLLDRPAQADLGRDGHPIRNTVPTPPEPGRRRMWAGGQVRSLAPLRIGESATRRTTVEAITEKQGRTGRLTFVTVRHHILQRGDLVVDERQDIVYRDAPAIARPPAAEAGPEVPAADGEWQIPVGPTLLFRYSALTYNGHRIHYDREYARETEGYPGLLTHGPLQATAMAEAARARGAAGAVFDYRLRSPLFDFQGLVVAARAGDDDTWQVAARDLAGRQTATGTVR